MFLLHVKSPWAHALLRLQTLGQTSQSSRQYLQVDKQNCHSACARAAVAAAGTLPSCKHETAARKTQGHRMALLHLLTPIGALSGCGWRTATSSGNRAHRPGHGHGRHTMACQPAGARLPLFHEPFACPGLTQRPQDPRERHVPVPLQHTLLHKGRETTGTEQLPLVSPGV